MQISETNLSDKVKEKSAKANIMDLRDAGNYSEHELKSKYGFTAKEAQSLIEAYRREAGKTWHI